MNCRDQRRYDRATRVQTFGQENAADSAAAKNAKFEVRARFLAYDLPVDFVMHLRADRSAINDANPRTRSEAQGTVEDTGLIGDLLGQVNDEITELDAIMHNKYTRQPEKMRAWQSVSDVERAPQREKKPTPALTSSNQPR